MSHPTSRPMLLNAFDMMVPVHQSPGLWRHPASGVTGFDTLSYWTELARTLERGGFASLFLADIPGIYDVHGGSTDAALRGGVQVPLLDPPRGGAGHGCRHGAPGVRRHGLGDL